MFRRMGVGSHRIGIRSKRNPDTGEQGEEEETEVEEMVYHS